MVHGLETIAKNNADAIEREARARRTDPVYLESPRQIYPRDFGKDCGTMTVKLDQVETLIHTAKRVVDRHDTGMIQLYPPGMIQLCPPYDSLSIDALRDAIKPFMDYVKWRHSLRIAFSCGRSGSPSVSTSGG